MIRPEGRFFSADPENPSIVRCELCPHRCVLKTGTFGLCRVRQGSYGSIALPYFGKISSISIDPIEKKPLYHFRPGSSIFSVGFIGCNLHCPFCQNWEISQRTDIDFRELTPTELVELAARSGSGAIAYTYSEPLVHVEYLLEAMAEAKKRHLANVLVSNGCILEEPARAVLALTDAANIDLKSFDSDSYRKLLGGDLDRVRDFIKSAYELDVHLEITTLIVTGINDSVQEAEGIVEFISSISPDIPWHLSAYHPAYQWREAATKSSLLFQIKNMVRGRLRYVYIGNIWGEENETLCPYCGQILIDRSGYHIETPHLEFNSETKFYFCTHCGKPVPIAY